MKHALQIFVFTLGVSAFYWYVSTMVPQKRTDPPEDIAISANLTTDEMVAIGQEIVAGKGTCLTCHTMGQSGSGLRFPDLGNIGAIAGTRKENLSDIEYLAESMYDPNAYIVEGFLAGMLAINKPPIGLNDQEILTIIAYLQSLGGTPTVTIDTQLEWQGQTPAPSSTPAATPGADRDGPTLFAAYLCNTCHTLDGQPGIGPSLAGVGSRLGKANIYESIMDPDAVIAEGFPAAVMNATLGGLGFHDQDSAKELQTLVNYLAEQ